MARPRAGGAAAAARLGGSVRLAIGLLSSVLVCVVVGCGSSAKPKPPPPVYSLSATAKCLDGHGEKTLSVPDPALTGSRGNLQVTFGYGTGEVDLVFGRDSAEARAIETKAVGLTERAFAKRHLELSHAEIVADVRRVANVFYYSPDGPVTVLVSRQITACLR